MIWKPQARLDKPVFLRAESALRASSSGKTVDLRPLSVTIAKGDSPERDSFFAKVMHGSIGPGGQESNLCAPVRRLPKSLTSARRVPAEIPGTIRHEFFLDRHRY